MIKRFLVGTSLGAPVVSARSFLQLKVLPFRNPEKASMVANGILADRLIAQLPQKGAAFLDVGAHIGSVLASVKRHTPSAKIYAVEAEPDKAAALQRRFPDCVVKNCAVGEAPGRAVFHLHPSSGYNSLAGSNVAGGTDIEVEVNTLDALFPDVTFDAVKIDVEGAEVGALRGGVDLFSRSRPTLMFESVGLSENNLGYSAEMLWAFLDEAGFQIFTPDRLGHDASALSLDAFLDAHQYPMRTHNYFAVAAERRQEVRDRARRILGIRA